LVGLIHEMEPDGHYNIFLNNLPTCVNVSAIGGGLSNSTLYCRNFTGTFTCTFILNNVCFHDTNAFYGVTGDFSFKNNGC